MLIFALSIFISSFLLFLVQPMIGKFILPWFGGTSSVWSASLLFFQALLFAGYAYSHWMDRRLNQKQQGLVHLVILVMSLGFLGFNTLRWGSPLFSNFVTGPGNGWKPMSQVLYILLLSVGLPYFLLSANSTLMQAWFQKQHSEGSPYWLYALSNGGSLLGLISYPFLIEPLFSLKTQSILWTGIFCFFVVVSGYQARRVYKNGITGTGNRSKDIPSTESPKYVWKSRVFWLGMAALASSMLLATTSRLTQEVAAIPLLWVLPLSIYLLSFMFSFSGERWYNRYFYLLLLFIATAAYLWFVVASVMGYIMEILIYLILLMAVSMICHGELYRRRPNPEHLTEFYLFVSLGGVVGGVVVNLVVPYLFKGYWEYQFGLGLVWLIMLVFRMSSRTPKNYYLRQGMIGCVGLATCLVFVSLYIQYYSFNQDSVVNIRNFYGVLNVKEKLAQNPDQHYFVLSHGITTHGYQFQVPKGRRLPTAYYTEESGIGIGFAHHPSRPGPLKVGVIGLGVGVLTAYGEVGDKFRFYEINPAVVKIARCEFFSYLRDTPATVDVILGDGRISLSEELEEEGAQNFDLIVLDAFNSGSIPTHLLTLEAFRLYHLHLEPDGILALHISNQHVNLRPIVWRLADELGYDGVEIYHTSEEIRIEPSLWILLTNNKEFLQNQAVLDQATNRSNQELILKPWTDDYSNLLQTLKIR